MWKALGAGAVALAIAGSSLVYAQQRPTGPDAGQQSSVRSDAGPRWQMTADDAKAFADARIAALKAGLKLTPEQEKSWPPVENAMRDLAKQRFDRMADFRERAREHREGKREFDPIDGMRRRADAMTAGGAGLKRLADAAEPLYKTLDDGQKRRLIVLARSMRPGFSGHGGWHHGRRGFERSL
ncbi:MAG: Spy/CpxP family protein refolding chaperone [Rhizobiales bacterium]|nr:Spy/CpxP family protein refolding chaperone [Hyphomicrobiales bacterium]